LYVLMPPISRRFIFGAARLGVVALVIVFVAGGLGTVRPSSAATTPPAGPSAYWLVASDGGVFTYGGVPFEGSAGGTPLGAPVVGMAATPDSRGYWLVGADGAVFPFGDAVAAGSVALLPPAARPSAPVVGVAATTTGQGYWEVTASGSIYGFGDAPYFGSVGARQLRAPVVGMAVTPDGDGYWLVASDGGIFAFGDAAFAGSTGSIRLNKPIVGMAATAEGNGYWLVASDGGIFAFGGAVFAGSTGAIRLNQPIVGMAATPDGGGYWLVASDGGIFAFGDAPFRGSAGDIRLARPVVGMAAGLSVDPYPQGSTGYDISWPQCGGAYPSPPYALDVVGVTNGRALTHNPCLSSEQQWGRAGFRSLYMNLNAPPLNDPAGLTGPAGTCAAGDTGCLAYNYGFNAAGDALAYATAQGAVAAIWWIDVETANSWDSNQFNNGRTIQGALDALSRNGVLAGIYSTSHQFGIIAGSYAPAVPVWVATGSTFATAVAFCDPSHAFGGGRIFLTQYGDSTGYDRDYACPTL
jgi:hypothetical protein